MVVAKSNWLPLWLFNFFKLHAAFRAVARLVVGFVALVLHRALVNGGVVVAFVHLVMLLLGIVVPASSEQGNHGDGAKQN